MRSSCLLAKLLAATLALGAANPAARAQQPAPTAAASMAPAPLSALVEAVRIPYETFTLRNGLRVIVHTDRKTPVVAVSVWYGVGSADEPRGKTGFAHLFEHLMFNGSAGYDGEFFEPLEEVGATNYNGTTSFDRTNYFQNVPTPALELALFLEADRMGNLLPALTQEKLDNQRGVVQNEKRQGDNQPYGLVFYKLAGTLFPEGHPYHHLPIGSMADLDAATLETARDWFRTHYGPNNAVLVLAGDIDVATARPLVERYFGRIPRRPATPNRVTPVPPTPQTRATMNDAVPNARLYFAWTAPPLTDPAYPQVEIAMAILAGGQSSRLYNDLVRDRKLAVNVGGGTLDGELAGMAFLVVDVRPGVEPAQVEARVAELLDAFRREGPSADEVGRVATRAVSSTIRGLEAVGGFGGKAVTLAEGMLYANDPGFYRRQLAAVASATPASVRAAAARWMPGEGFRLAVMPGQRGPAELALIGASGKPPAGADTQRQAREPDRSKLPRVMGEAAFDFPAIERATLSNGVEVQLARRTAVPVVLVSASFDAGLSADDPARPGTAAMVNALLNEGTLRRTGPQIIEEAERLGASLGFGQSPDRTRATLSALRPNLAASLDLFADVVMNPRFDPAEVERVRAIRLAALAQEEANPGALAQRLAGPAIYGEGHPYARPGSGTRAGLAAVTRDDLVRWHRSWMRPETMTLFVAGDTTLAEIVPLLERTLGSWRADPAVPRGTKASLPPVPARPGRVLLVNQPDAPQSFIAAGMPLATTGRDDPIALDLANDILGGSFTSRLNSDLRETKGWSYGVRSQAPLVAGQMAFRIAAPVQTDRTAESIVALKQNIRAFTGPQPPTPTELLRALNANTLSLPGSFESASAVLTAMEGNALYGRPDDYFERLSPRLRALGAADLARTMAEAVDPDRLQWVVVGDAGKVRPQLEALGLPVEVRAAP